MLSTSIRSILSYTISNTFYKKSTSVTKKLNLEENTTEAIDQHILTKLEKSNLILTFAFKTLSVLNLLSK